MTLFCSQRGFNLFMPIKYCPIPCTSIPSTWREITVCRKGFDIGFCPRIQIWTPPRQPLQPPTPPPEPECKIRCSDKHKLYGSSSGPTLGACNVPCSDIPSTWVKRTTPSDCGWQPWLETEAAKVSHKSSGRR